MDHVRTAKVLEKAEWVREHPYEAAQRLLDLEERVADFEALTAQLETRPKG